MRAVTDCRLGESHFLAIPLASPSLFCRLAAFFCSPSLYLLLLLLVLTLEQVLMVSFFLLVLFGSLYLLGC
jgi:hypothetical protein